MRSCSAVPRITGTLINLSFGRNIAPLNVLETFLTAGRGGYSLPSSKRTTLSSLLEKTSSSHSSLFATTIYTRLYIEPSSTEVRSSATLIIQSVPVIAMLRERG